MLLTSHSQDGAAQPLQGEGPLSERHREGHTGMGTGEGVSQRLSPTADPQLM